MASDSYQRGMAMRRKVLGDAHVDRSIGRATAFDKPLQDYLTAACWGEVWTRPGLAPRDRSLVNLAMLTALNRPHELEIHVRGALNNGVTVAEISEVLLQSAVYCGAPAAIDAFRTARAVIEAVEAARDGEQVQTKPKSQPATKTKTGDDTP